ncbi:MAG: helix-turn-helix transcriptional regulator [Clostridia bacterium]|nr:helix-turn-helix transcriptional regulator [Clostridia bacterium]MBQ8876648.1 helix-turn-helix transcriptional regulator [Clostridia bacterium]
MITTQNISEKLAEAIKQSGMKQTTIAEKIGVRQQQISCYIKGITLPSLDTLSRLCTALDLDANEILCVERPKEY